MYELTQWQGNESELALTYNPICIDGSITSIIPIDLGDDDVNVFDVEFNTKVSRVAKTDYLFAIFSGLTSYGLHRCIVRNTKIDLANLKIDKEFILGLIPSVLNTYELSSSDISDAEDKLNAFLNEGAKKVKSAGNYRELVKDFAFGLSYKALFMSIVENILECRIGLDESGNFAIVPIENKELIGKSPVKKIYIGFTNWLINEADQYSKNGEFKQEANDFIKVKGGITKLQSIIKELSETKLYKGKNFNETQLCEWFTKNINNSKELDKNIILPEVLYEHQLVSIELNKGLVRIYCFIKEFISQVKEHNVKTLEGLEVIELKGVIKSNKELIARMDSVSTGIYSLCNASMASAAAIRAGVTAAHSDLIKEDYEAAIKKGFVAGAATFAVEFNLVGFFTFINAIKVDKEYILKDIKELANIAKVREIKQEKIISMSDEDLARIKGLTKQETKILYSLELQLVNKDIYYTKDNKIQLKKNAWKKEWMEISKKNLEFNKLFIEDEELTYKALHTYASTNDETWLYKVAMELAVFKPYCPLGDDTKKYKGLKLSYNKFFKDDFCLNQKAIEEKEVTEIQKLYKKYDGVIKNDTSKTLVTVGATIGVGVATAGAAYIFAPAIAVGLVGSSFAGLSGAALTSASLAMVGGGALTAGGLGMAGGTMIIAGGGALLGAGASAGISSTAFALLTSSDYVKNDYAKLLTKCDYILLNKFKMVDAVIAIKQQTQRDLDNLKTRINIIENVIDENNDKDKARKDTLKELKTSEKYMNNALIALEKMITKYNKV